MERAWPYEARLESLKRFLERLLMKGQPCFPSRLQNTGDARMLVCLREAICADLSPSPVRGFKGRGKGTGCCPEKLHGQP